MATDSGPGLYAVTRGSGPRIVLVHGFTQNHRCWGPVADDLARDHEMVLVDAPGHGRSAGVEADLRTGADLIAEVGGQGTYLGYSMGARFCLQLALDHPDLVTRLVVVGASPGIADEDSRSQRRERDGALADRMAELGLPAFIDEWLAQPLFAGLDAARGLVRDRLDNTVEGLQSSLRLAGTGSQPSLWPRLEELAMPVLVVTGASDHKFCAIADEMVPAIGPNARHLVVPTAGHAAHLENRDAFLSLLRAWLRKPQVQRTS